jgi:hypothetical protein
MPFRSSLGSQHQAMAPLLDVVKCLAIQWTTDLGNRFAEQGM